MVGYFLTGLATVSFSRTTPWMLGIVLCIFYVCKSQISLISLPCFDSHVYPSCAFERKRKFSCLCCRCRRRRRRRRRRCCRCCWCCRLLYVWAACMYGNNQMYVFGSRKRSAQRFHRIQPSSKTFFSMEQHVGTEKWRWSRTRLEP